MKNQLGITLPELLFLAVLLAAIVGWVLNIVKLANMCCEVSGMLLLRAAGVFVAAIGAIIGWF